MRISDWSSDVCSSDLARNPAASSTRPANWGFPYWMKPGWPGSWASSSQPWTPPDAAGGMHALLDGGGFHQALLILGQGFFVQHMLDLWFHVGQFRELDGTGVFDLDEMPAEMCVHGLGGNLNFFQALDGLGE